MTIRYSDLDLDVSGAKDFVLRQRTPSSLQLLIIILSVVLIAVSLNVAIDNKSTLIVLNCVLLTLTCWYVLVQVQRSRDLLLATEFQNSIFASALGLNNIFSLIIKRDGTIVYIDRSFQNLFPEFARQSRKSVESLLRLGKVEKDEMDKILVSIDRGTYEKIILDIRGSDGIYHRVVLTIEPIVRPSGFILLRGREYIEKRSHDEPAPPAKPFSMLNKSSITLLSNVMDTMQMGVYMTDPNGNLVYANSLLEQWLGFHDGEMISKSLSLKDIVHDEQNRNDTIVPDDFEGNVILQRKIGGTMRAFINQKVNRNEEGRVIGCTAIIHNVDPGVQDVKKKSW